MRINYMASMFGCYTTFDNLPDSSEVWNELEKELGSIGKAALTEEDINHLDLLFQNVIYSSVDLLSAQVFRIQGQNWIP